MFEWSQDKLESSLFCPTHLPSSPVLLFENLGQENLHSNLVGKGLHLKSFLCAPHWTGQMIMEGTCSHLGRFHGPFTDVVERKLETSIKLYMLKNMRENSPYWPADYLLSSFNWVDTHNLFMIALGLCCCTWAFSSCGVWGFLWLWCSGFSLRWLLFSGCAVSAVVVHRLSYSAACRIFPLTRDQTRVRCIGRRVLDHWTAREVLTMYLNIRDSWWTKAGTNWERN